MTIITTCKIISRPRLSKIVVCTVWLSYFILSFIFSLCALWHKQTWWFFERQSNNRSLTCELIFFLFCFNSVQFVECWLGDDGRRRLAKSFRVIKKENNQNRCIYICTYNLFNQNDAVQIFWSARLFFQCMSLHLAYQRGIRSQDFPIMASHWLIFRICWHRIRTVHISVRMFKTKRENYYHYFIQL